MQQLTKSVTVVACLTCLVLVFQTSQAMYGLCSTNWYNDTLPGNCFDNNDECKTQGGKCHPGNGDHNEGCYCRMEVYREDHWEYLVLTKDHFAGKGRFYPAAPTP